jgi:hypothetical protein
MNATSQAFGHAHTPSLFNFVNALIDSVIGFFAPSPESDAAAAQRLREFAAEYAEAQPSYASDLNAAADGYDVYKR